MNWLLVALIGYLIAQLAIGAWLAPKIHTESDYLIAGRRLGYPLTVFSIFATWFGVETCIAAAGRAYQNGVSLTNAEPFGYGVSLLITALIFAIPLWRSRLTTLADLFRIRYSVAIERLAAMVLIPSGLFWAAAQLRGFGQVLVTITNIDLSIAIVAATGFCVFYTMLGGLMADAITDLIQGVILVVGLAVLLIVVVSKGGGMESSWAAVPWERVALAGTATTSTALELLEEWTIPIAGSLVAAELVSRIIAARSPEVARNGAVLAGGLYLLVGLIPLYLGLIAARHLDTIDHPEQVLPALALKMLPGTIYVIFAGALLSAILSTVDTILLIAAGLATHNIVSPLFRVTAETHKLWISRTGVLIMGLLALFLALAAEGVGALVEEASAFGSAGTLVVVSFGLFSRIGGPRAAAASLLAGLLTYMLSSWTEQPYPYLTSLAAAVAGYLIGALGEKPPALGSGFDEAPATNP